jgi:hypothetical protein
MCVEVEIVPKIFLKTIKMKDAELMMLEMSILRSQE